ncbi:Bug family tripartite tricarboxylate transporter substrate binding protein [Bordetella genomosp. 9]|uniref:Bug family tripartite tricarboxylate transporter substrate binding protein n=1 Tax=Bordetella genomosp. 9 TaxID=1416803 RepID=UPI0015C69262|nr:tripartite tricarboxylate transporter substrate binding protein [Bordetella genomosp. 9]
MTIRLKAVLHCALLCAALAFHGSAQAQNYPDHSVTIVVGYSPGGSGDQIARLVAQELTAALGQSFIVQNRPGAAGIIGSEYVSKAAHDGYTLMSGSSTELAANVSVYPKLPYDPVKSFVPIIQYSLQPNVLLVRPDSASVPVKSVQELIAYAKAHPDRLSFGSAGTGSSQDMAAQLFMMLTGTRLLHVPYKGGANAITDLMGGQIDMTFQPLPEALAYIQSGRLLALAVSGSKRSPLVPNVPTMQEAGVKGYEFGGWHALVAPAGTPQPIIEKLNGVLQKALQGDLGTKLQQIGLTVSGGTPAQAAERQQASVLKFKQLIEASGATATPTR